MTLEILVMSIAEIVGAIAFLYIAYLFIKVYRGLRDESSFLFSVSYLFLGIAQICAFLSIIVSSHRLATTFYVATSSFAIAGFISMLGSTGYRSRLYIVPLAILLMSPDIVAGILSIAVSLRSIHITRIMMLLLSISFFFRGISIVVAPSISPIILLFAEVLRATIAIALSIYHVSRVVRI
ncbi:hypothetical protein Igag_0597 [Ignisphaera aggregans DSM 17230]|uniref:Uncharacterized protein n=1 Tax=Ignisphaera aggregans (strain DSM 17230 / JCM 13409 / AQ1.S1) TaxID=583356 RepID=E0SSF9_IGNAA|nr:hypothetical protein Igag_0597 [Ignisphaera aggregans DSM 17230]